MFKASFYQFIELSKKIASSLLNEETVTDLYDSELFQEKDKEHIFNNVTNKEVISKRKELANSIDIEEDWNKVKSKINSPVNKFYYFKYSLIVAASIVLGVLLGVPGLLKPKVITVPIVNKSKDSININNNFNVGNNAVLTLEDGSHITLIKGKGLNTSSVSNIGDKLVYKKSKEKKIKYNYLTIPRGGQYFIELSDGSQVWLNSESQLKYPIFFIEGRTREVELVYGEAYFTVSASTHHNGDGFKVINSGQEIDVLGTEFNVKAYKDEKNIYTTLVEGKVTISTDSDSKLYLKPNEQSILNVKNNKLKIKEVDVKGVISWKKGVFSFKDKKLKEIMKVISRWYDMDVIFTNKALENIVFKGVLGKDQDIEEILHSIKTLSVINGYEIVDKTIILK